jgi:hypothetical protein
MKLPAPTREQTSALVRQFRERAADRGARRAIASYKLRFRWQAGMLAISLRMESTILM